MKHDKVNYNLKLINKTFRRLLKYNLISSNCLEKSITLRLMLIKLGIPNRLIFSIAASQNLPFKAHSYVEIPDEYCFFKDIRFNDVIAV